MRRLELEESITQTTGRSGNRQISDVGVDGRGPCPEFATRFTQSSMGIKKAREECSELLKGVEARRAATHTGTAPVWHCDVQSRSRPDDM